MSSSRAQSQAHDVRNDIEEHDETTPLVRPSSSSSSTAFLRNREQRPKLILRGLVALLFLLFILLGVLLLFVPPSNKSDLPRLDSRGRLNPAHLAHGSRGGVAAENGVCSQVGVDLMQKGGSAADAAVGAALCVGTLNMFSSGIGGGGFALIRAPHSNGSASADHITVDFRETAPAAAFEEMYHHRPDLAKVGGLAVGVPGELRGLEEIWKRWGKLPWADVVQPNIDLAKEARVGRELARRLQIFGAFIRDKPEWREVFINQTTGQFLKENDTIRRSAYAETLQAVADHGSQVFYEGPIAEALVDKVQATGGIMTLDDLQDYSIETRQAIRGQWTKGRRAWTTPMPTSGSVLLQMMNVLRELGFEHYAQEYKRRLADDPASEGLWAHRLVEVMKHGFASRTRLGDPSFLNATSLLEAAKIPTRQKAHEIVSKINDDRTFPLEYYDPLFDIQEDHGTTHVSVTDSTGLSIGITSTVNLIFGSQVMDPITGVILNDEMDDTSTPGEPNAFGLRPSPYNYPQPHKRPLSSISPLIIETATGHFELLLGGAGGSHIPTSVLQTLLNLERGYNLSEAIEELRLHHQLLPSQVAVETSVVDGELVKDVRKTLVDRGHELLEMDVNFGLAVVQGVQALSGSRSGTIEEIRAASDSRKNGWAAAW